MKVQSQIRGVFLVTLPVGAREILSQMLDWPSFLELMPSAGFLKNKSLLTSSLFTNSRSYWFYCKSFSYLGSSDVCDSDGTTVWGLSIPIHITGTWLIWKLPDGVKQFISKSLYLDLFIRFQMRAQNALQLSYLFIHQQRTDYFYFDYFVSLFWSDRIDVWTVFFCFQLFRQECSQYSIYSFKGSYLVILGLRRIRGSYLTFPQKYSHSFYLFTCLQFFFSGDSCITFLTPIKIHISTTRSRQWNPQTIYLTISFYGLINHPKSQLEMTKLNEKIFHVVLYLQFIHFEIKKFLI